MSGKRTISSSSRIEGLYGVLDPAVVTIDAKDTEEALEIAISEAIEGGCRILQFRDKQSSPRMVFPRARRLAGICRKAGAFFLVNDRLDAGLMAEAEAATSGRTTSQSPRRGNWSRRGFFWGRPRIMSSKHAGLSRKAQTTSAWGRYSGR
jgi:hypothetical protein